MCDPARSHMLVSKIEPCVFWKLRRPEGVVSPANRHEGVVPFGRHAVDLEGLGPRSAKWQEALQLFDM